MYMQKKIEHILAGREKQITPNEKVRQPLPHADFRFANPFIVLHHMGPEIISPGGELRIHPHPHRGFSPVTIQLQGEGYHKDNAGHDSTIHAGDVQWMFAGKGILHSEGPTKDLLAKGGTQELIQLWINAPAAHKAGPPSYQYAPAASLPRVLEQEGVQLRLASGDYDGRTGPLNSFTPVVMIEGAIAKGRRVQFTATPGFWTLLYITHGRVMINCESIDSYHLIVFEKENDEIIVTAEEDTRLLYLSAEPIDEPVAAKDNFVMNTQQEIEQALDDARNGRFGTLAW